MKNKRPIERNATVDKTARYIPRTEGRAHDPAYRIPRTARNTCTQKHLREYGDFNLKKNLQMAFTYHRKVFWAPLANVHRWFLRRDGFANCCESVGLQKSAASLDRLKDFKSSSFFPRGLSQPQTDSCQFDIFKDKRHDI